MKKYLLWWLAIVILWVLVYLGLPYIKYLTLYWLTDEQKERFEIVAVDQTFSENYQMYKWIDRRIEFDNFIIDRFLLDKEDVAENYAKYSSWLNAFLTDYNLTLSYERYIKEWDEHIFDRINEVVQNM